MEILRPTFLEKVLAKCLRPFTKAKETLPVTFEALTELYNGQMVSSGNFCHRQILSRWVPSIKIDDTYLEELKWKASQGPLVYVTFNLGQLEYNLLSHILRNRNLPLASFNNALRVRRWFPLRGFWRSYRERIRYLAAHQNIPDPIQNGYLEELLLSGKSLLFSLPEIDPNFLPSSLKNFLDQLLAIQKKSAKPIFVVPCQLIWDKRPKSEKASAFETLFGENQKPGRWRKMILFFRHYKKRVVQKWGEAIVVKEDSPWLYQKILSAFQLERQSLTGPMIHPRQWFFDRLLEDEGLSKTIYEVAKEKQKPIETVKNLTLRYAKEIAANLKFSYLEWAVTLLAWVFKNWFEEVVVDPEGINRLKKTLKQGPVILVPNHRSHLDYLLMGHLCYQHDIGTPYVAAGINMAFWPMGWLFRRCGAFFLRRSFEGNKLYKKVFQTYLKILIGQGYLQEFFIEGGRSRTGKLRPPRLGMLSMVSDAIAEGAAKDIYFVPVSITYDRVLEEKSYLEEMGGKPKAKEKTTDLWKLRKFLKGRYGKIYAHFEEPISWQSVANEIPEGSMTQPDWEKKKSQLTVKLADQICHAINRAVVATPMAVTATALLLPSHLGIPVDQAEKCFFQLLHYLQWKKIPLSATLAKNPRGSFQEAIHQFESSGQIKRHEGLEAPFFEIPAEKRPQINFFKNFSIHRFVSLALWSRLLLAHQKETPALERLAKEYALFQDLFQYEFRFSTRRPLLEHLDTLCCYLQEQQTIRYQPNAIQILPEGVPLLKNFSLLLQNYFEAYTMAWETFLLHPTKPLVFKELLEKISRHAQDQFLLGRLRYPEAITSAVFETALQAFKNLGLFALAQKSADQFKKNLEKVLNV